MIDFAVVPLRWRKSSRSNGGNGNTCVEVGAAQRSVAVRDSKHPHGGILTLTATEWRGYLATVKAESES